MVNCSRSRCITSAMYNANTPLLYGTLCTRTLYLVLRTRYILAAGWEVVSWNCCCLDIKPFLLPNEKVPPVSVLIRHRRDTNYIATDCETEKPRKNHELILGSDVVNAWCRVAIGACDTYCPAGIHLWVLMYSVLPCTSTGIVLVLRTSTLVLHASRTVY